MRTSVALLALLLTVHTEGNTSGHSWTYPEKGSQDRAAWSKDFPTCAGEKQSPINIKTNDVWVNPFLKPLKLSGYDFQEGEFQMINNGHSGKTFDFCLTHKCCYKYPNDPWQKKRFPTLALEEHLAIILIFALPPQLHIVHYNSELYSSFEEAENKPHGLAVISVLIKAKKGKRNDYYEQLFSHLSQIGTEGENITLTYIDVLHMLPHDYSNSYHYEGSLTTPPCTENVSWIVLEKIVTISTKQLKKLQKSLTNNHNEIIQKNFRETQPLNHRKVEANFLPKEGKQRKKGYPPGWSGMF
ncbi:carbonic anhydrase 6 [Macrotis lagotis]|uniref:carbonic anhydrase 6 n=1 Tax=Macrotis lagotis TaxID=92651 RepID=UPI003D699D6C